MDSRLADTAERFVLIGLLGFLAYRLVPVLADRPVNVIYLIQETLVVVMVARRRPTNHISLRPTDWLVGFVGTLLPLLVTRSDRAGFALGGVLLLLGFGVSLGAQLSLARSFGVVAANRGVKTTGFYGVVRHPMYLGYFLTHLGFLLANPSPWNAAIIAAWTTCQLWRIHIEERVLSSDLAYVAFAHRVRYRLVPFIY